MDQLTIIAEIAQGYEGKPAQAAMLLAAAAAAGADAVKFQLVYAEELAAPDYVHFPLFRTLEMPDAVWEDLAKLARDKNIELCLDVFGKRSLALAQALRARCVKIHATDMANTGLLQEVAGCRVEEVLLSCGGCYRQEIDTAVGILRAKRLVLLHGYQGYPTPTAANQIARLEQLRRRYAGDIETGHRITLGFADHAPADDPLRFVLPAAAIGAGATVIEKHLTLARIMQLEDHESALDPDEFAVFTAQMRACHAALGSGGSAAEDFGMTDSEREYRRKARKHVVALRDLPAGAELKPQDLGLKRTSSTGVCDDLASVCGKRLKSAVQRDQAIGPHMLESGR
jgi:N,N'-diacetyllegionaminate synthase